ncbi:MAG: indole-3-glycerol phosphate synthase TrpC [Ferruginibacter sp.]
MSTILDTIVDAKKEQLRLLQKTISLRHLEDSPYWPRTCISLKQRLFAGDSTGIIAEFKRKSPSKGWFKKESTAVDEIVLAYEQYGAAGISVLTDEQFFGGNLTDLTTTRALVDIPLLRKDFIIDEWQIAEAKANGADVILLIAACLSPGQVKTMAAYAKELAMEVLLEIHSETELAHICPQVDMVGINNRNLKNFEVSVETSLLLIGKIPPGMAAVSESGISSIETIKKLQAAGFRGFLMGENFMKAEDPALAFQQFVTKLQ